MNQRLTMKLWLKNKCHKPVCYNNDNNYNYESAEDTVVRNRLSFFLVECLYIWGQGNDHLNLATGT